MKEMSLTQCLLAKFCHDLAGNLTALSSGVDFFEDKNPETRRKAHELITLSTKQTVAKLGFFRAAYGTQKYDGEADLEEIRSLSSKLLQDRVVLDFNVRYSHQPEVFICANTGKLILCMIYTAYTTLLYGGTIRVDIQKTKIGKKIIVTAAGKKIKYDVEKNRILSGDTSNSVLSPSNVHYYYTFLIMQRISAKITTSLTDKEIQYTIE